MKSRQAIDINASMDTVWELVNDIPKWANLMGRKDLRDVQHWESGPPHSYLWTGAVGIQKMTGISKFIGFEPPKKFVEETMTSTYRGTWSLSLTEQRGGGTHASLDMNIHAESGILSWILYPLRYFALRSQAHTNMVTLKARAENEGHQASDKG